MEKKSTIVITVEETLVVEIDERLPQRMTDREIFEYASEQEQNGECQLVNREITKVEVEKQ